MTFKQLEAFYWAAMCDSFATAAERCHLSVSSLSKRIAELEMSLGCELFDRTGRSARLTSNGDRLLPGIAAVLKAQVELRRLVGPSAGLDGRCRIGVSELSSMTWLPTMVARTIEEHPRLSLLPSVYIGQELENLLMRCELDLIVISGPSTRSRLASEIVGRSEFVWVASPSFVSEHGGDVHRLVGEETLVTLSEGAGSTRMLDHWLSRNSATMGKRLTCNSLATVVGLILQGTGFGVMPLAWAQQLECNRKLRILEPPSHSAMTLDYVVQWIRDDPRDLVAEMRRLVRASVSFSAPACFC